MQGVLGATWGWGFMLHMESLSNRKKGGSMTPILGKTVRMNKTEAKYGRHLEELKQSGEVLDYRFEPFSMRLAEEKCFYHPDFFVVYPDRFEVHEVKAFDRKMGKPLMKDDALVKVKIASTVFPWWEIRIVWWNPTLGVGGEWEYRTFK